MENTPEAPVTPEVKSEATPNTNTEQTTSPAPAAPDMHGFTSDQLADMKKFFEANGGFDKIKAKISNPEPKVEQNVLNTPAPKVEEQAPAQPAYKAPVGSITREEFLAKQYFSSLAKEEKYASIAKDVESGTLLDEMVAFNIKPINPDGSINDAMVRRYLDLKAQTVVAKQTSTTPEASAAPTVEYAPYDEKTLTMQQAVAILQQDSALKAHGQGGHPNAQQAEEFMKKILNKKQK